MALGLKKAKPAPKPVAKPVTAAVTPRPPSNEGAKSVEPAQVPAPQHKFTPRQAFFMDNWMISRNATQAAIASGYAKGSAKVAGSRLLTNGAIRAELDRRIAALRDKMELDAEWVIKRLMRMADANMADYMKPGHDGSPVLRLDEVSRDQAYALDTVTVEEFKDGRSDKREVRRTKFGLVDRVRSLELLGKNLKLFGDNVQHDHQHQITIVEHMLDLIDADSRGKVIEHQK